MLAGAALLLAAWAWHRWVVVPVERGIAVEQDGGPRYADLAERARVKIATALDVPLNRVEPDYRNEKFSVLLPNEGLFTFSFEEALRYTAYGIRGKVRYEREQRETARA